MKKLFLLISSIFLGSFLFYSQALALSCSYSNYAAGFHRAVAYTGEQALVTSTTINWDGSATITMSLNYNGTGDIGADDSFLVKNITNGQSLEFKGSGTSVYFGIPQIQSILAVGNNTIEVWAVDRWGGNISSNPFYIGATCGVCGATNNTCASGTLSDIADTSDTYQWICLGTSGGTNSSTCTAPMSASGSCGTNAQIYTSATSYSGTYCTGGNPNPAAPTFPVAGAAHIWSCIGENIAKSCSELKDWGDTTSGVKTIDPDGRGGNSAISVYCDMTTDGGGWTMVVSQRESDPVSNWNEGIQGDYNPALAGTAGFALSTAQIPAHSQVAIGKVDGGVLSILDYFDYSYTTGNIYVSNLYGYKTGATYQTYRNTGACNWNQDPEWGFYTDPGWENWANSLTFDKTGGAQFSWAFGIANSSSAGRGYSYNGSALWTSSESFAWVVLVRSKTGEALPRSCSEIRAKGDTASGVKTIDPDGTGAGSAISVYCDMTTDGGGWTMVVSQRESDPVSNWNEGIQGDYNPALASTAGFALSTAQIPAHSQVAIGKVDGGVLSILDYFDYSYTTGNIAKSTLYGIKTGKNYHTHRDNSLYYSNHDPEQSSGSIATWNNTLTFDQVGGTGYSWSFAPNNTTTAYRGYAYGGIELTGYSDTYPWVILVRSKPSEILPRSCSELKSRGDTASGVKTIDPDGVGGNAAISVYCNMTTDGGGWTLIAAQYENDPVSNWNEGIQGDYDPDLSSLKGFTLSTAQIPTHNQVAYGQDLTPLDYVNFTYSAGNISLSSAVSPKTSKTYQIHRNADSFYNWHDPEQSLMADTIWNNSLTFDQTGGAYYNWAFSPQNTTLEYRGFNMNGTNYYTTHEAFAWTLWVREDLPKTSDCYAYKTVDGSCGTAAKTYAYTATDYGTYTQCATGVPSTTVFPAAGSSQNWTCSGVYGGTTSSTCTATHTAASSAKAITAFSFASPAVTGTINETNHTVAVTVPYGTNVTSLTPTITISTDATISPLSGVAQNFTNPVTYRVTAQDETFQDYVVTVNVAAITAFSFASPAATGSINQTNHTVAVTVPYGTNVTSLTPTITISTDTTISPLSGVAQNFTNPVTYRVTAQGGAFQDYVVTVNTAQSSAKAITAFSFASPAVTGTINETNHTVAVTVPYGTNVTSLTPTITISTDATISPLSGVAQNFTNPVTYRVTAQDETFQDYVVTVNVAAITAFSFASPAATGSINQTNHTVAVTVPYGTNVTSLTPTITISTDATISPLSGVAQNFTNPVTYRVTAQ
ncbi:MAG: fibrinogen-like YCDxxxxGGGW domain-containing protein, partial [Candidatus Pacebacteria bacterium]|nr:fibrinogen-like YCDxxxxGGGW domain-containing protein [Candidatus Paceibacterota bacterium]